MSSSHSAAPSSQQSLPDFLQSCQARVNREMDALLSQPLACNTLQEAMRYACLNGGKRIRPVLVYASALAVQASLDDADTAACAVEFIHSYSLAHDDLPAMDDDDLRRGKPSLHKAFDEATAILVGDALQSLAFQVLARPGARLNAETQLEMIDILGAATGAQGMVGGQSVDFAIMGKQASNEELEAMHRLKTGALIQASIKLGALCQPDLDRQQLEALDRYASCIGLAFQVQDDVLDEISDTVTLGKPQGSDRLNNKPTYVSLLGLEGARAKAEVLHHQAMDALSALGDNATQLRSLATYIVERTH